MSDRSLGDFLGPLCAAEVVPKPVGELWEETMRRIAPPGIVAEIDEETYLWFLECLPPKYQGRGCFAFAEGAEPLRFFWRRLGLFFVRQLTWEETQEFCALARIPLPW